MIASRWGAGLVGIASTIAGANPTQADQPARPTITMEQRMTGAKAECETLMNSVLPFAKQMRDRHGEFYPYGAAMGANGEIVSVAGYEGHEHPQSNDVIRFLKAAFTAAAKNGQYKATALVYDVRATVPSTGEKSDAIAVSLNHRDGSLRRVRLISFLCDRGSQRAHCYSYRTVTTKRLRLTGWTSCSPGTGSLSKR